MILPLSLEMPVKYHCCLLGSHEFWVGLDFISSVSYILEATNNLSWIQSWRHFWIQLTWTIRNKKMELKQ